MKCSSLWSEAGVRLKNNKSIDIDLQKQNISEKEHRKKVLERIIDKIIVIGKNNLAFQDQSDKLFISHKGDFLGLVE